MTALFLVLANGIAIIHLLVALYLVSLPVVMLAKKANGWYLKVQVAIVATAGIFHFTTGVCPLTFAENYCRSLAATPTYKGNFLNHYAETLFHFSIPNTLVSNAIIVLAILLVGMLIKKYNSSRRVQPV